MSQTTQVPFSADWQQRLGELFTVDADAAFRELEAEVVGGGGGALACPLPYQTQTAVLSPQRSAGCCTDKNSAPSMA